MIGRQREDSMRMFSLAAVLTTVCVALASPCWVAAGQGRALSSQDEAALLRDDVDDLLMALAHVDSLDARDLDWLKRELAQVRLGLDDLVRQLAGHTQAPPPDEDVWQPYASALLNLDPPDARFAGWQPGGEIELDWGGFAELVVTIDNVSYTAVWTIREAYSGEVSVSLESHDSGDILLEVTDERGFHELLIEQGGLGPVYVRGRGQQSAEERVNGYTDAEWYGPYHDLVATGRLQAIEAMDWFIEQCRTHHYENDALRTLGEYLNGLGSQPPVGPLGELEYYFAGEARALPIPDPRRSPGDFADVVHKAYILSVADEFYTVVLF